MKAERDIAVITIPFAAGLAAGLHLCSLNIQNPDLLTFCPTLALLLAATFLLHPHRSSWKGGIQWTIIAVTFLFIGAMAGCGGHMLEYSHLGSGMVMEAAAKAGAEVAEAIDRIPFADTATNGIIKALITGERNGIPAEITAAFRESGASHILALSGLHLGIIYGILRFVLGFMGNTPTARTIRSMIMIICCGAYTIGTGCGPSIARAFLFILIGETAALTGRRTSLSGILMTALIVQTLVHPSVINEIGFQLSYAAVAGIAFIYPKLRDLWPGTGRNEGMISRGTKWIWNSAAMSVACQITTGPIAYAYFGTFPEYFILTNLIALPLTGLLMPAALLTLAASELGICPDMMSRVTELLVTVLSDSLGVISTM